tara:strand:+ start:883 stop:1785 length:903 start_codon:yes stop_codon:yes gene_type:complete
MNCGSAPRLEHPDWYTPRCDVGIDSQSLLFCGDASADTRQAAMKQAITRALAQAASQIATTVQETVQIDSQCVDIKEDGIDASRCTEDVRISSQSRSADVTFRGMKLANTHLQRRQNKHHAFIQVRIPKEEWTRLNAQIRGQSLLAIECDLDGRTACPDGLKSGLSDALLACGIKPVEGPKQHAKIDKMSLQRLAQAKLVSQIVTIRLKSQITSMEDGLFKAMGRGSWTITDTFDGRVVAAKTLPTQSHVAHERGKAVRSVFRRLPKQLTSKQCGLTNSMASLCCALGDDVSRATPKPRP